MPDAKIMIALSTDSRVVGAGHWWPWAHHYVWN